LVKKIYKNITELMVQKGKIFIKNEKKAQNGYILFKLCEYTIFKAEKGGGRDK